MGLLGSLHVHWCILTPLVLARKAVRLVNTEYFAALRTGPPFLFVSNELSQTELLYIHEIVNHTHAILGSIALIQVIQPVTGKAVTTETESDSTLHHILTVLDSACDAGF